MVAQLRQLRSRMRPDSSRFHQYESMTTPSKLHALLAYCIPHHVLWLWHSQRSQPSTVLPPRLSPPIIVYVLYVSLSLVITSHLIPGLALSSTHHVRLHHVCVTNVFATSLWPMYAREVSVVSEALLMCSSWPCPRAAAPPVRLAWSPFRSWCLGARSEGQERTNGSLDLAMLHCSW